MTPTITPPWRWRDALATRPVRTMDPAAAGRLVVVAAHPDDETLAAGGFTAAAHAAGATVTLVVATDGEAAFPGLGAAERAELARMRRRELTAALAELGLADATVHLLGLPDSGLHADAAGVALREALRPLLAGADSYLAPWTHDPHPDHAAAGRAAAEVAPVTVHGWSYPLWALPWGGPDDPAVPWQRAFRHDLDDAAAGRKRRAVGRFASQLDPALDGGPPILPAEVLAHFAAGTELFFRAPPAASAPPERFAQLYGRDGGDPWATRSSWYEIRKRAVLLASLPRARYRHGAEPGCGTGASTAVLAARCDRLDASDFTAEAVAATAAATAGLPGVTVGRCALPDPRTIPSGVDLAVLSEVLYYLSPADLDATVDRLAAAVEPGGDVAVVHWLGWPAEAPHDAVTVHHRLRTDDRFDVVVEHTDAEFLLHVFRRR